MPELRRLYESRPLRTTLTRDPDPLVEFGDCMNALMRFLHENRIPTLVCAQPVLWKPEMAPAESNLLWMAVATREGFVRPAPAWLCAEMARYNDLQRRLAAEYGARFVDLAAAVPASTEMFIDDCHFTDEGSRRVADAILLVLRELLAARRDQAR
jgi:hypothetical protein